MTRLILAAGVAALAITAPASAKPDRQGDRGERAQVEKQGQRAQASQRVQRTERVRAERPARIERAQATQRVRAERPARIERAQRFAAFQRPERAERQRERAVRTERVRTERVRAERPARIERQELRANRVDRAQNRAVERQGRLIDRDQLRANRIDRRIDRQELRADRQILRANRIGDRQALRAERQVLRADNVARVRTFAENGSLLRPLNVFSTNVLPVTTATTFIGVPLATAATFTSFNPLPMSVQYLYPDTDDYYYRFGNGYLYEVDRDTNLIAALLPLLFGGFMPGQYLPNTYMSSYMPSYYGFNSFYPDYGNDCYRYGNGVIYEVDCFTGFVEDVIPLYAGGYGVGQMLPSAYSYYNVPLQYRSLYYDTPDYGYWYAPGAIYQYDRGSSLITSVASLLSPGFSIGQQMPMGYGVYNVPYDYRATYYDTPNAWYRYNNGYIYQVDPTTQLVTAIVASILT